MPRPSQRVPSAGLASSGTKKGRARAVRDQTCKERGARSRDRWLTEAAPQAMTQCVTRFRVFHSVPSGYQCSMYVCNALQLRQQTTTIATPHGNESAHHRVPSPGQQRIQTRAWDDQLSVSLIHTFGFKGSQEPWQLDCLPDIHHPVLQASTKQSKYRQWLIRTPQIGPHATRRTGRQVTRTGCRSR